MKLLKIVKNTDRLGRLVIPKWIRSELGISHEDVLELFIDKDAIILKRYFPFCIFCGSPAGLIEHHGQKICRVCLTQLQKASSEKAVQPAK